MTVFTAIYQAGCLRPTSPLSLPEGAEVQLVILQPTVPGERHDPAKALAEIAALPTQGGDPNTSRDHDKVLYGGKGVR